MAEEKRSFTPPASHPHEFMEMDPSCRYGRYSEIIGRGAFKTVFRGFDTVEGVEVAWNRVKLSDVPHNASGVPHIQYELWLLNLLRHPNLMKLHACWFHPATGNVHFITELFVSGTLREYRKRHKMVEMSALKKWSTQILLGLAYLHSQSPPIIHRDLKCDNIFVNGNTGEVKIGDLGFATILHKAGAPLSVCGTPEFMAPELYLEDQDCNELVDIYSFGMCMLELITLEYPYSECSNVAQIYRKVVSGIKPLALKRIRNTEIRQFIESCLAPSSVRPSAMELLAHPFLQSNETQVKELPKRCPFSNPAQGEMHHKGSYKEIKLKGTRENHRFIKLIFSVFDKQCDPQVCHIHCLFDLDHDTPWMVAKEMVQELGFAEEDLPTLAGMIAAKIDCLLLDWDNTQIVGTSQLGKRSADPEAGLLKQQCFPSQLLTELSALYYKNLVNPQVVQTVQAVSM